MKENTLKKTFLIVMIILVSVFVFYFIWNGQYAQAAMEIFGVAILAFYLADHINRERRIKKLRQKHDRTYRN